MTGGTALVHGKEVGSMAVTWKICWVDTREKLKREAEERRRRVEREKRLIELMVSRGKRGRDSEQGGK